MDEATRERCFEPLFTTKGPFKGTGMGLAAARRLAEESHGSIACRSQLGHGTTFEITFPTVADDGGRAIATSSRPNDRAVRRRYLIVDDDEELRRFMSRILERNGYHVTEADSGEAALRVVD